MVARTSSRGRRSRMGHGLGQVAAKTKGVDPIEWNAGFPGQNWPAECFPVVDMEEDKWMPIRVNFWQENLVPSLEPYAYEGPEDITVRIKVWWGILDISGQPDVEQSPPACTAKRCLP